MVSLPPDISADILVDGAWHPVSVRTTTPVTITRGASSEGSQTQPGHAELALDNRDGDLSPRDPNSLLFDKIGRNTGFRFGVHTGAPYLRLDGVGRASTPDAAAVDITGSIDVRIEVALDDWALGEAIELAGKYTVTTAQRSWLWRYGTTRALIFRWSPDGTAITEYSSTETVPVPPSGRIALRSTLDTTTGVVTHYTAPSIDGPWTQLGDASAGAGATSLFNSDRPLEVGDVAGVGFVSPEGAFYAFQLYDGIDGTLAADIDFTAQTVGDTPFVDGEGLTWTLAGAAEITDRKGRMRGEVPAWPPRRDLTGADVWSEISPAGILRRLGGNKPLQSVMRRETTDPAQVAPLAYWPCEDGENATSISSATGGQTMRIIGAPDMAGFDGFACSDKLPVMRPGAGLNGAVPRYAATSQTQVRWLMYVDTGSEPDGERLISVWTTGTAARWDLIYHAGGNLQLNAYDQDGTAIMTGASVASNAGGKLLRFSLEFTQDGADIDWARAFLEVDANGGFVTTGTLAGYTMGRVSRVVVSPGATLDGVAAGHVAVYDEVTSLFDLQDELNAWNGERAGRRIDRLCAENQIPFTVLDDGALDDTQRMGRQRVENLVKLLQDAADADRGLLLEQRDGLGLTYKPLSELYNQEPAFTLRFTDGVIGAPFKPTDDDKLTENDVTVKRVGGSEGRAVLESGKLSIQDPPDGVGLGYDVEHPLNVQYDGQTLPLAGWLLHLGTHDGMRYTKITLDLANPRVFAMIDDILQADVGRFIRLTDRPADHGPDDVDLLIRGYSEEIGEDVWRITFTCDPGEPYAVAVYDTDHRDTAGSQLAAAIDDDEGTAPVLTSLGPLWTLANPALNANADFETDLVGWSGSGGTIARVATPGPAPFPGSWSLQMTPGGVAQFPNAGSDQMPVTVGQTYVVSGYLRCAVSRSVALNVNWFDGVGAYMTTDANDQPVTANTWTWFERTVTAPVGAATANLAPTVANFPPSTDVLMADQVTLRPVGGTPQDFRFLIRAGGEVMAVTAVTPAVVDTFTRTTDPGWGTPDIGEAWVSTGGDPGDHFTQGSEAAHELTGVDVARLDLTPAAGADFDVEADIATAALATGGPQLVAVVARATDGDNLYMAQLSISTTQTITLTLRKRVAGVETQLDTFTTALAHSAFTFYRVRFQVSGSELRARVRQVGTADAGNWQVSATDTSLTTGSGIGLRSVRQTANTNANLIVSYDNLQLLNPQQFHLERSVNGIVKAHAADTDVVLAKPAIRAL